MVEVLRYTHRVSVHYQDGRKLEMIKKINRFLLHQAKGPAVKRPLFNKKGAATEATGLEISFSHPGDAVMFKLSWDLDAND